MNNNNKNIIQIGSHVGNTINDPIFNIVDNNTTLILVEPIPFLFEQLKNNYKEKFGNNQNIFFINKAVSNFIGEIEMTFPSEKNDFSKLPFWTSQLASVNPDHVFLHNEILIVEKINVKTTTINEIIKEYSITQIDLLHTDTEGHDFTILMNYNFEIKPKKIMFEHKHMDGICKVGKKYIELSNRLLSLGYKKIHQDTEDTTFQLIEKMDLTHRINFIKESNLEDLEKLIKKLGSNTEISSE
jgi:FkbM family methyltransferase